MPIIGITGGIASGKSSFVSRLSRHLGEKIAGMREGSTLGSEQSPQQAEFSGKRRVAEQAPALPVRLEGEVPTVRVFDADAVARELAAEDTGVREAVIREFGPQAMGADGALDRAWLREAVFHDTERRKALEAILHPRIRARWQAQAQEARREGHWLLLDIPLLYETGAEQECDAVAVVACRETTQRERIVARRGLSAEMAGKIIATQTSLASKAARADYVIWNDAPEARLEEQAELFAGYLILWMNNLPR